MISKSNIENAGQGLFADRDYNKGEAVCQVIGEKIPYRQFHQKYGTDTKNSIKVLNMYYICFKDEPYRSQNKIVYINESNDPNVKYFRGHVVALRPLTKGEEIYLKYPRNYPRDYLL